MKTLDRVLSKMGLGSRTEARQWIGEGRVRVNGKVVRTPDVWVNLERDKVSFDGRPLQVADAVYLLLYKPKGYVTTYKDPDGRPTVYDLLTGVEVFVGTVGRLDLDTSGLLLLTNDHALADRMTSPDYHVEKEYLLKASVLLTDEQLAQMRQSSEGVKKVERVRDSEKYSHVRVVLTEGKNRQVRKMVEDIGATVLKLVRVRIGPLVIGELPIGKCRLLSVKEVQQLKVLTKLDADQQSKRKLRLHQGNRAVLGRSRRRKRS